jgi:probable rRNA maturation factor
MILNRQKRIPIPEARLARFLARVRREMKLGRREVTVCFVDDREIARLNRRFRGKPKPTDVLSFPGNGDGADEFPSEGGINFLGDIAISPEAARRNARRFGRTLDEELRVLILHGVLHLTGYDHETDHGEMEALEKLLRRRMDIG